MGQAKTQRRIRSLSRRDGLRCVFCGKKENLTIDHIVPRAYGGNSKLINLQLACDRCNNKKGSKVRVNEIIPERLTKDYSKVRIIRELSQVV